MSRIFSRSQKQAVEIVTGRTGEADHIILDADMVLSQIYKTFQAEQA
jgi:hypothetical protein